MKNSTLSSIDYDQLITLSDSDILNALVNNFANSGLQATNVGRGREIVQQILFRKSQNERVFLSYTSNLISCGLRETFSFLAKHQLIDGVISSAGGVEEDVIKCLGPTYLGRYDLNGKELRRQGINRIGNLLVPNDNYCLFEDYFTPILKHVHALQEQSNWEELTSPSELIYLMGKFLENKSGCEESLVYWCYKNNIPFFCPALTDGSMGDMIYFYNFSKKGMIVDPLKDVLKLRSLGAARNSAIVLGAGLPKHHLLTHISMDNVVFVTTGVEADGCTSSCILEDDVVSGLVRQDTVCVRIQGDATVIFPLLVTQD